MVKDKLTPKQKAFADYYLETGNAFDSYRRAYNCTEGTARVEGFRNLEKPLIRAYIDNHMAQVDNKRIASAEEVLQYLTSVVRGEVTEQKILFSKEGSEIAELGASVNDRNKAAELLGKRYALFTDKKQLEGNIGITIVDDIDEED